MLGLEHLEKMPQTSTSARKASNIDLENVYRSPGGTVF